VTATARARLAVAARALIPFYLLALCVIVFSPSDEATEAPGLIAWVFDRVDELRASFEPAYVALEFVANIALFVPFGVLGRLAFARPPWWAILLLGFATTVTIELVQSTLPTRFSTASDVIANTAGTALGLLVVRLVSRRG
jgi:glycopeptide antibiotics resistance protein